MKKFILISFFIILNGCDNPTTGRDVFGNIGYEGASAPVQIGDNKYYTEAQQRPFGIERARVFCSSRGKTLEVIKIDVPENEYIMVTFSCN